jgi:hypothetical protein
LSSVPVLDDEQQFRGWACFLQITITARPAVIIRLLRLPVGKENISLCIAFPACQPRWSVALRGCLTVRMGTALVQNGAGIFEKLPEKSSSRTIWDSSAPPGSRLHKQQKCADPHSKTCQFPSQSLAVIQPFLVGTNSRERHNLGSPQDKAKQLRSKRDQTRSRQTQFTNPRHGQESE